MLYSALAAALAILQTITFDQSLGLPEGWSSGITGKGTARWEVIADDSAASAPNVLRQSGEATFCWAMTNRQLFEVQDDTFQSAGAVGVWTKADSVTLFDDVKYGTITQ